MDVFEGPTSQELGEEKGEGVVYSVILKRVRYGSQSMDPGHAHLRWASQKVRAVLAGTLEKLVEHLSPQPEVMEVSHAYRTCFLCTYRSFAEPGKVVELLVRRYLACTAAPGDTETESTTKKTIQEGIISFFRLWLETHPQDFSAPPLPGPHSPLASLQPLLQDSHDLQGSHDLGKTVSSLREELQSNGDSDNDTTIPAAEESDSSCLQDKPSQSPLFSLTPEDFSNALTSEDARLFLKVRAPQCLDYIRSPKDTTNAPSVRACIEHFNRVSLVVIATVLGGVAPDARAFVIGHWIDIAHHCRGVKNFSSLKAIVSGLQSTAVFRLKRTWEKIPHHKLHLFQELTDLLSADDNYQSSRDLLNREGTAKHAEMSTRKGSKRNRSGPSIVGVVPYLGTFLTDLTMIDSAHQDRTQDDLINFEKFRRLFQLLAELTLYQKSAGNYCFTRNDNLLCWLRTTHTSSPSNSYELSKQLEPDSAPNHILSLPETSQAPISPSRIRRGLRQIFNVKVGDYTPPQSPSHSPSPSPPTSTTGLTSSISARDLTSTVSSTQPPRMNRSTSMSPSTYRRGSAPGGILFKVDVKQEVPEAGRVVRVAFANSNQINYKSLRLTMTDKTHSIIQQSLEKLGISGEPKEFNLFQVIGNKHQLIPANSNVFYALSKELHPTLIINSKT